MIELPVINGTAHKFNITLNDNLFKLNFRFNSRWNKWLMTIQNSKDEYLLINRALASGVNIVRQYDLPTFLDNLFVISLDVKVEPEATFINFGDNVKLISLEEEDKNEIF